MELVKPGDLFRLSSGAVVSKRNLFDLIQHSKVEGSPCWDGPDMAVGNTPQQGINWIGPGPEYRGVIIKTRPGSYQVEGWTDDSKNEYRYSFKARKGNISYKEKANQALIYQPLFDYPVLLFTEERESWVFAGTFSVSAIHERHVVLKRLTSEHVPATSGTDGEPTGSPEGMRRYVTHLMAERNRQVVLAAKRERPCICEICEMDFNQKYGVSYIEAHHKKPMYTFEGPYIVKPSDLALLCPNCHRAVHAYMRSTELEYPDLKDLLRARLGVGANNPSPAENI